MYTTIMDSEEKRKQLEQDILDIMEKKLSSGEMDAARARAIAQMLLEKLHPPLSLEQLYEIAPTLDDHFTELSQAVLPLIGEHDNKIREIVSKQAEKLIQQEKLDESYAILKQATNKTK